ncbi:tyrosine-type recombinase/integrase [Paenalcaligenes suwonensis]|uniref:tyrosine-type recombinase/integrase n=1 Tax=Paenalcaligenes suwonensis TaxID=1202713 RepID=UPI001408BC66|nr:integrase family protein [Paenalcaligenes suwonensis]NHC60107.1 integrase family protein [Paenalcaligenes suwonensis]
MSKRVKLTAGRVREFGCPEGKSQAFLWDSDAPGFALRATAGAKAFIFQGRLGGKSIRVTIGDVNAWTIDKAREKARNLQIIIDDGRDPREVKAEATAADTAKRARAILDRAPALDAWNDYLKARTSKWSARTLLDHQRLSDAGGKLKSRGRKKGEGDKTLSGPLYGLLQLPLVKIDRTAITDWLREQQHRPTVARSAFVRLRAFLNWCSDRPEYKGQAKPDACSTRVMRAELPKAQAKDDCLQREQLALWFQYVRAIANPVISAYLQTALLTGARREEVAELQWTDIDFQWESLTIRDKVEGTRTIPMTPYVKSLLLNLQRLNSMPSNVHHLDRLKEQGKTWKPSQWVFFSPTAASGRIQEPRVAHNKAIQAAGLPHLTIHGLRRSFGTLAEWVECPAGVVAQLQGHKPSATAEKHYRRRPLDLLRMWHSKIEGWILDQAGIEQNDKQSEKLKLITSVL